MGICLVSFLSEYTPGKMSKTYVVLVHVHECKDQSPAQYGRWKNLSYEIHESRALHVQGRPAQLRIYKE